uniref:Uncharacterized protein n=1 Tax=Arundo donax TaxID=35708 RepID=A0A0A9FFB2_ARUDO
MSFGCSQNPTAS